MPIYITGEADFDRKLRKACKAACLAMRNDVYNLIDHHLHEYYSDYNPVLYDRTRQLLHSLVKEKFVRTSDNGYEASVYFDMSQLDYTIKHLKNGRTYKQSKSKEELADIVMNAAAEGYHGTKATAGNDPENASIWNTPMKYLEENEVAILRKKLEDAGILLV